MERLKLNLLTNAIISVLISISAISCAPAKLVYSNRGNPAVFVDPHLSLILDKSDSTFYLRIDDMLKGHVDTYGKYKVLKDSILLQSRLVDSCKLDIMESYDSSMEGVSITVSGVNRFDQVIINDGILPLCEFTNETTTFCTRKSLDADIKDIVLVRHLGPDSRHKKLQFYTQGNIVYIPKHKNSNTFLIRMENCFEASDILINKAYEVKGDTVLFQLPYVNRDVYHLIKVATY